MGEYGTNSGIQIHTFKSTLNFLAFTHILESNTKSNISVTHLEIKNKSMQKALIRRWNVSSNSLGLQVTYLMVQKPMLAFDLASKRLQ